MKPAYTDGLTDHRGTLRWTKETCWRVYWMSGMREDTLRGDHALRETTRTIFCLHGSFDLSVEMPYDGPKHIACMWSGRDWLVPPKFWTRLENFSDDCVVLVLADKPYDPDELMSREEWEALDE